MQPTPRRDPKKFASRTMAAAIAAAALATTNAANAQTTGGGIGAAVNGNANASAGTSNIGTSGSAGGTATSGVAAPNAPASPVNIGSGPGINNTGSPVVGAPKILQAPIGGKIGTGATPNGSAKLPGNVLPGNRTGNQPVGNPGVGPAAGQPPANPAAANPGRMTTPQAQRGGTAVQTQRSAANMRTGTISNFTNDNISFREGANTSTLGITPNTVVQMDGRNISLRDIPANAQVRVERSPTNPNAVQRIVVVPQAAAQGAANANANTAGNTLAPQPGPGQTPNSGNKSVGVRRPYADNNVLSSSSDDLNAPVVNNPNPSSRPFAPGRNPADQPVAPFTRGPEQRLQAGFDEPATRQNSGQTPQATADGSQFLGPQRGKVATKPGMDPPSTAAATNGAALGAAASPQATSPEQMRIPFNAAQTKQLNARLGMQIAPGNNGMTLGPIANNSIAANSGLVAGDRIQSINGQTISSNQDFGRALYGAGNLPVINGQVMRNGSLQDFSLSLPTGFFNDFGATGIIGAGGGNGVSPSVAIGADGQVSPGVNVGGAFVPVPANGEVITAATQQSSLDAQVASNERSIAENTGAVTGNAAAANAGAATQPAATDRTAQQPQQQPLRVRQPEVAVGTQKNPITTEALKLPPFELGGELKATSEGVVVSSLVNDGLAAQAKLESGDIIESIDSRPVTAPGAVAYEMHRHRAGSTVDIGILRDGKRMTRTMKLPADFEPQFLNRSETFGAANNQAKEQGASGARPIPLKPTEESIRTLEAENQALRDQLDQLRKPQSSKP